MLCSIPDHKYLVVVDVVVVADAEIPCGRFFRRRLKKSSESNQKKNLIKQASGNPGVRKSKENWRQVYLALVRGKLRTGKTLLGRIWHNLKATRRLSITMMFSLSVMCVLNRVEEHYGQAVLPKVQQI